MNNPYKCIETVFLKENNIHLIVIPRHNLSSQSFISEVIITRGVIFHLKQHNSTPQFKGLYNYQSNQSVGD